MAMRDMSRRGFLHAAGMTSLGLVLGPSFQAGASPRKKPNIVLIFADDLGYREVGVQGCPDVPTPNIDSIATNGVRFTNGYVSCPVCSPTRAGLMTGRYQQRFGHEFNPGPANVSPDFGLSTAEKTIAERVKPLGYATGMFGKWHLGFKPEYHPLQRGFDEFYGFLAGAHPYLTAADKAKNNPILRGNEPVAEIDYATDAFAREAVSFIDRHADHPFFLYLPFNAVHGPLEATDKYRARFEKIEDPKRRTFAAMLSALDDNVGLVLARLRERGLEQDTLVFFISDNGGPTLQTTSANNPLRGFKGQVLEGGIRVPFMMQWKGRLPAGTVDDRPVISLDVAPTVLAAAGEKPEPSPFDGVNLMRVMRRPNKEAHDALFWRFGDQCAVRMGDYKLLSMGAGPELYNLADDIGETKNLAAEMPDRVKQMQGVYDAWNGKNIEPKWKAGKLARKRKVRA